MVILYRPSTNKIIKIIEGNFLNQHDVDIIDDKEFQFIIIMFLLTLKTREMLQTVKL